MIVQLNEYNGAVNIMLHPENAKEISQLTRLSLNAKPYDVEVATFFNNDNIGTQIHFNLYNDKKTSLRNTKRPK